MREPSGEADVVILGAGIAGGALAVTLARAGAAVTVVDRQPGARDFDRGEFLAPWGLGEATLMGVDDCIVGADTWPVRRWIQWDEIYDPDAPPIVNLADWTEDLGLSVESPMSIRHYSVCQSLEDAAKSAGAAIHKGCTNVQVHPGDQPFVTYSDDASERRVNASLVVAACGRRSPVARQLGLGFEERYSHWGTGITIDGVDDWPEDAQALGTEGDLTFYVFPQGRGRVQLYLHYRKDQKNRFAGRDSTRRVLEAFDFSCMPISEQFRGARPLGTSASYPTAATNVGSIVTDGVVLIGDEAGSIDPVLGTGLANAIRDARMVAEVVLTTDRGRGTESFSDYVAERRIRHASYSACADLMAELFRSYGHGASERRRNAMRMINDQAAYRVLIYAICGGPEHVPESNLITMLGERLLRIAAHPSENDARSLDVWSSTRLAPVAAEVATTYD